MFGGGFGGFPFGDMPGMGGMPGGGRSGSGSRRGGGGDVNNRRYYELLNVEVTATQDELKKAHRKLALKLHPDKGGDPDKFKEINEAYDVLKDPEKRRIYDEFGEDAIKEGMGGGGPGGGGMGDLFDILTGGRGRGPPRERRSEDVVHKLQVALEDLYNGVTKKLSLSRKVACGTCSGKGTRSGKTYQCEACHGSGIQVQIRPIGPGMVQQIQSRCSACSGTGNGTPASDRCGSCSGACLVSEKKTFEVQIEPGMRHGHKIVLRGEAGCSEPGLAPGDVVLLVMQKEHGVFKRLGHNHIDLLLQKKVSLREALCGVHFMVKHLDGRVLKIGSKPGEVIKPDSFKVVAEEGMPMHGRPFIKGNLYIQFTVEFPEELDEATVGSLRGLLPEGLPGDANGDTAAANGGAGTSGAAAMDEDAEECHMRPVLDIEEELKSRARLGKDSSNAYDSDGSDDGMPHGQRVQCAQQ